MRTVSLWTAGVISLLLVLGAGGLLKLPAWVDDMSAEQEAADRFAEIHGRLDGLRADLTRLNEYAASGRAEAQINARMLRDSLDALANPAGPDYEAMQQATVLVRISNGHGSGVIAGPRLIITAAHVARSEKVVTVEFHDGTTAEAEVVWLGVAGHSQDIAALRLSRDAPFAPATLSCRLPSEGETLLAIGNPRSGRAVSSSLRVASKRPWSDEIPDGVVVQGALIGGMSGGPVFDAGGLVIGLSQAFFGMPMAGGGSATGFAAVYSLASICDALPTVRAGR